MKKKIFIVILIFISFLEGCKTAENREDIKDDKVSLKERFNTKCVNNECVVYDKEAEIYWQRDYKEFSEFLGYTMNFSEAIKYCEELEYGGFIDWRLPTVEEASTRFWGKEVIKRYNNYCNKKNVSSAPEFLEKCILNELEGGGPHGLYIVPDVWGDEERRERLWTSSLSEKTGENIAILFDFGTITAEKAKTFFSTLCVRKD